MKTLKKFFLAFKTISLSLVATIFFLLSCTTKQNIVTQDSPPQQTQFNRKFAPIKDYYAILECVSKQRTFSTNQPIQLRFKLTNLSSRPLIIYEWMQIEDYNIKLRYQFLKVNNNQITPVSDWEYLIPKLKPPVRRQTIELNPNTSCIIEKSFNLSELSLPEDFYTQPYLLNIIGELNLESIKLSSETITINFK